MKTIYDYFRYALLASVAVLAICMCMFSSCSGDDNDVPGGGSAQIGVHRVDVHFDNALPNWDHFIFVHGIKPDGTFTKLYENGKELSLEEMSGQGVVYSSTVIRDYSISTEKGCGAMAFTVTAVPKDFKPSSRDVTITAVGYIDGKRIYTKVVTIPAGTSAFCFSFATDDGGGSELAIDGKIVEKDHD